MQETSAPVRAVLFDLGGVLLDIDFGRAVAAWTRHSRLPPQQVRERFAFDEPFRHHETGRLDDAAYFAHLRQALDLDCELSQVEAGFNAILIGEITETVSLLQALRGRVPCYAISNTNPAHVLHMRRAFPGFLDRFDHVFTSHEIGHRKPQPESFAHVLQAIGLPAGEVLLFDDLAPNVEAARALGLQAVLVRSPADVRKGLADRGLLS
ncbi:HAD family phosphatase [Ramlibacter sp. USB13]|uniref:HAD family phosphatase n=1 Tax=Ramlibacter cellulosilyticus TaxID=2764187 RepID=A0A923MSM6_9BURK|nr:HAD family phosphatase [Ramlibacter cellulosilyticus]MBC5784038.1 HAD family phosphatase [Ramlibacter cellulosilyticus]